MTDVSAQEFLELLKDPVRTKMLKAIDEFLLYAEDIKYTEGYDRPEIKCLEHEDYHIIYLSSHTSRDLTTLLNVFGNMFSGFPRHCRFIEPTKVDASHKYERMIHITVASIG